MSGIPNLSQIYYFSASYSFDKAIFFLETSLGNELQKYAFPELQWTFTRGGPFRLYNQKWVGIDKK